MNNHHKKMSLKLKVRSYELDSLNHVNNAVYLNYLEYARVEFLNSAGMSLDSFIKEGILLVLVNINVNYRKFAKMHDDLKVTVEFKKIGTSSVTTYEEIINISNNEIICDALSTYVFVDAKTEKSIPIPEKFIKAFSLEELRQN